MSSFNPSILGSNGSSKKLLPHPLYRDFNNIPVNVVQDATDNDPNRRRGGKKSSFPKDLFRMLQFAEENDLRDIVAWQPHGRSFVIKDKQRFAKEVLPKFFEGQKEFASFQRQLNVYGFLRMTGHGPERKAYYHEMFLRGRGDLIPLLPRKRRTLSSVRQSLDPKSEPDFSRLSPSFPKDASSTEKTARQPTWEHGPPTPARQEPTDKDLSEPCREATMGSMTRQDSINNTDTTNQPDLSLERISQLLEEAMTRTGQLPVTYRGHPQHPPQQEKYRIGGAAFHPIALPTSELRSMMYFLDDIELQSV